MTAEPDGTPDDSSDAFIANVRAKRLAAGRPPYIENPVVYRFLDAVLANTITDPKDS